MSAGICQKVRTAMGKVNVPACVFFAFAGYVAISMFPEGLFKAMNAFVMLLAIYLLGRLSKRESGKIAPNSKLSETNESGG